MMGGPIQLKKTTVPHIFNCQKDRHRTYDEKNTKPGAAKRKKMQTMQDIKKEVVGKAIRVNEMTAGYSTDAVMELTGSTSKNVIPENINIDEEINNLEILFKDVGVQAKPYYRSKATLCQVATKDMACSPLKQKINAEKSDKSISFRSDDTVDNVTSISEDTFRSTEDYFPSEEYTSEELRMQKTESDNITRKIKLSIMKRKPKMYMGIPEEFLYVIDLIYDNTGLTHNNIYLTLTKIKMNDTFARLGDEFGMSASNANKIFNNSVPLIANCLKPLIFWPKKETIQFLLPLPFRARYSNVQSIIDCLEIEIQKPTNAVHQALTWSDYKKCNTLKYLISSTPDGMINYISCGYGGRISDTLVVENCGYLDKIPPGCGIMADRGFKHIEHLVLQRGYIDSTPERYEFC